LLLLSSASSDASSDEDEDDALAVPAVTNACIMLFVCARARINEKIFSLLQAPKHLQISFV